MVITIIIIILRVVRKCSRSIYVYICKDVVMTYTTSMFTWSGIYDICMYKTKSLRVLALDLGGNHSSRTHAAKLTQSYSTRRRMARERRGA